MSRSLRQAVPTALILLALIVIFGALGQGGFFVLACVVVIAALVELIEALRGTGRRPSTAIAMLGGLGMLGAAYEERFAWLSVVLASTMVAAWVWALRPQRGPNPATDVAWTLLGVAWIGGGGAGAAAILTMDYGLELLIGTVLVAALGDIGAFFGGTRFGRTKLAPSISPAKSWEGFVAGALASLAGGAVLGVVVQSIDPVHGLAVGGLCAVLGPAGDLVESMVKREIGIKDSGRILPGHGGFLDRLDAIIFCAPAVAIYLRIFA